MPVPLAPAKIEKKLANTEGVVSRAMVNLGTVRKALLDLYASEVNVRE
jgi:hypothetical protein